MRAPTAREGQDAARCKAFGKGRRVRAHAGQLTDRSDEGLASLENRARRTSFDRNKGFFLDETSAIGKVQRVKAQVAAIFRMGKPNSGKIATHCAAKISRNSSQQFAKV